MKGVKLLALLMQIATACFFTQPLHAAESTVVHAGYRGIADYQLPLWINKEVGISRKYGIELEPLLIGGGALNMLALVAGSSQLSQNSASSAIQPALRGTPIVLIAIRESRMPFQIIARSEIKAPEQLIGKKIGIQRFGYPEGNGRAAAQSRRLHRHEPARRNRARGNFSEVSLTQFISNGRK